MTDSPSQAPQSPASHREIIALWPSLSAYATGAGIEYGAAKQQRRRNSIPSEHWPAVVADAESKGLSVSHELLARTAPSRRRALVEEGALA